MTPNGKIYSRKRLGTTSNDQRKVAKAIKRARYMATPKRLKYHTKMPASIQPLLPTPGNPNSMPTLYMQNAIAIEVSSSLKR